MCQAHHIEVGPHTIELMRQHLQFAIEQEQETMDLGELPTMIAAAERLIDFARCAIQLEKYEDHT